MGTKTARLLPLTKVEQLMNQACHDVGFNRSESQIADALVAAFPATTLKNGGKFVLFEDAKYFVENWINAVRTKDFDFLTQRRGRRCEPVGIEEFIDSKDYLNQKTQVWPAVKRKLCELYEHGAYYPEVILTGATGIGKDYMAYIIYAYSLYELWTYYNPQIEFGLAAGTSIVLSIQSVNKDLAKKVTFDELVGTVLSQSRFFRENFLWNQHVKTELQFPGNIFVRPFSAEDTAALGMAIFAAIVNEANFMKVVSSSKRKQNFGQEYNQAERIFSTLSRRISGRFNKYGRVPGKMLLVSSKKSQKDFVEERLASMAEMDEERRIKIFVVSMSQWEAREGTGKVSAETFLVEKGGENKRPRIIETMDDAVEPADVIHVPVDYKTYFKDDLYGSLADIAGVANYGDQATFIPQRDKLEDAFKMHEERTGQISLFNCDSITFNLGAEVDYSHYIDAAYLRSHLSPTSNHAVHIDYGFVGDATGFSIGHIQENKLVTGRRAFNKKSGNWERLQDQIMPVTLIDGALPISATDKSEVDISLVEGLIEYLSKFLRIKWVTFDSYESRASMQRLRRLGYIVDVVSTVANTEPYMELREAINTGRMLIPRNPTASKELRNLVRLPDGKIDHLPNESKDVADSIAGVSHVLRITETRGHVSQKTQTRSRPTAVRHSRHV